MPSQETESNETSVKKSKFSDLIVELDSEVENGGLWRRCRFSNPAKLDRMKPVSNYNTIPPPHLISFFAGEK